MEIVAVDAESGELLWDGVAPRIAVQSLAMGDGKVVYHNCEELVALDAAQHFERGGYAVHEPGSGNHIVANTLDTDNLPGGMFQRNGGLSDKTFDRTGPPLWITETPVIIRSILVAPDDQVAELVFTAGIVEGTTREQWDQSTYFIGPGKLLITLANGDVVCFGIRP